MLCSVGSCDSAIATRCCMACGKFRKLHPVLASRHLSPKVRGKLHTASVCSTMLHGSKTWGPNILELKWLHCNYRAIICWICGTKDQICHRRSECVKTDISDCGLTGVDPQYRDAWRASVQCSLVLPTPLDGTRTAP